MTQSCQRRRDREQGPVERPGGKGRHAGGLHVAVERLVEEPEPLVVRAVARAIDVEDRDDQTRLVRATSHPRGRLDVFGRHLRLGKDGHQAKPGDIEADRDHVRGQRHIDPAGFIERTIQGVLGRGDLVRAVSRGELLDLVTHFPIRERRIGIVQALTFPVLGQPAGQLVFDQSPGAAQLAKAAEIAEHRHVGIGGIVEIRRASTLLVQPVSRRHDGQVRLQEHALGTSPLGRHTQVEPRRDGGGRHGHREERVVAIRPGRRENLHRPSSKQGADLIGRAAHRGRR